MKNCAITVILIILLITGCSGHKGQVKDYYSGPETEKEEATDIPGISKDSVTVNTRPGNVLLTGISDYRLTPVYKLNYDKKKEYHYTGNNHFYRNYDETGYSEGNQWHFNFMPGLQAVYGFNIMNVSVYNIKTGKQKLFFDTPVLIKTIYFPSFSKDTLYGNPVMRDYYMISVYDEDTNKDGFINFSDLRHFYLFDINCTEKTALIPPNYSVISSEYDSANDFMYVFAQIDENGNGQNDEKETIHVFWIDLKDPHFNGREY